ncbi:hypothetical protein ACWGA9_14450 [Streptomyces sp. NPDC054950]|nr:hypothetical protein OV320_0174 [Actinobacteria bacterium OV320]
MGRVPLGFDAAVLYAYTPLQPNFAGATASGLPSPSGSPAGLAAEPSVYAMHLGTVTCGDKVGACWSRRGGNT